MWSSLPMTYVCMYVMDCKEGYVLRKLQRHLSSTEMWCKHWNININEDKTLPIYFFIELDHLSDVHLTLNKWNIPFVKHKIPQCYL
jgi:hypothetical protein